jgi:nicotinamide-nucleotide amidase
MNAEIIAVGSELLTPQRLDTNSLYLTNQLNALGIEVAMKTVVGDHRERLQAAVAGALQRSEVVVITGGLGPTEDDLTREAVAAALGRDLLFSEDILDAIEQRFRRLARPMAAINRRQAYVITGAEVLPNPHGTAPGLWLEHDGRLLMLLPGPPREMKPLFEDYCVPRLQARLPRMVIRVRTLRVAGMPESEVDQRISPIYTRYSNPVTTILAAPNDIQIHFRARCETEQEADALLEEVSAQVEPLLGERIYTRKDQPMEARVGELLSGAGKTVVVAESCTGGLIAQRLTAIPGSSTYFIGGFLPYQESAKTRWLGISPDLIAAHTVVSEAVALAMAEAARGQSGADYALSTTGVAGPGGATEQAPVGTVWIALASSQGSVARKYRFIGERERVRTLASQNALDLLRVELERADRQPTADRSEN